MIKDLWLIGIGMGSLDHITLEGQRAIKEAAVILVPRKGAQKDDLAQLRLQIIEDIGSNAQIIPFDMPVRDENLPYQTSVAAWHDEIANQWAEALKGAQSDGPVALLVWGDPGLYDSTLRIADRLHPKPTMRVVPGITAMQVLTSAHAVPFNTVDGSVVVTTGRQLRGEGWPQGAQTVFVMLDGKCSFEHLKGQGLYIWWGAFLGMGNQTLIKGPLDDISDYIIYTRAKSRATHGWIMDTYLLRKIRDL
ncbi:MAG: precorrin-6A synthase (deacetylating) [Planktomarina sp.]